MTPPIAPTAPTAPSSDAPVNAADPRTLADASSSLAAQLYTTPPVVPPTATQTVADSSPETVKPSAQTVESPTVEGEEATDAPEFVKDDAGKWHRADGTMASAEEIAQIEAQLAEESKAKEAEEANRPATVAKLRDRAGNLIEVETGDEQLAQLINQNTNDGMRKREYVAAMAEVEASRAEFAEFQAMLRANPEGVVLQHLPPEKQVSIAAQLLAQHFDALIPIINGYAENPGSRISTVAEAQKTLREQEGQFSTLVASQRQASEVKQAVAALIPDTVDDATAEKFWKFASMELTAAVDAGIPVSKENVGELLKELTAHYGFAGAAPAAPQKPRITLARPATPAAAAAGTADAKQQQQLTQRRLRLSTQRRNAAAIPPSGRGGFAKPSATDAERERQSAANLLYGNTPRAS